MTFETLDKDTQNTIDTMVSNAGLTREDAILALVEFGMVSMIAAVRLDKREEIMQRVFDAVNGDDKLQQTANDYKNYWDLDTI